jgi:hypothetical protein
MRRLGHRHAGVFGVMRLKQDCSMEKRRLVECRRVTARDSEGNCSGFRSIGGKSGVVVEVVARGSDDFGECQEACNGARQPDTVRVSVRIRVGVAGALCAWLDLISKLVA